jgi:hypothetical protein
MLWVVNATSALAMLDPGDIVQIQRAIRVMNISFHFFTKMLTNQVSKLQNYDLFDLFKLQVYGCSFFQIGLRNSIGTRVLYLYYEPP